MSTGVAEAVEVSCVPPALFTVTVADRPMVHVDVDPDVGAPKVTVGVAVVPPEFTVAVLALAPGVYVQVYVVVVGGIAASLGLAEPCKVAARPEDRFAPEDGETIFT